MSIFKGRAGRNTLFVTDIDNPQEAKQIAESIPTIKKKYVFIDCSEHADLKSICYMLGFPERTPKDYRDRLIDSLLVGGTSLVFYGFERKKEFKDLIYALLSYQSNHKWVYKGGWVLAFCSEKYFKDKTSWFIGRMNIVEIDRQEMKASDFFVSRFESSNIFCDSRGYVASKKEDWIIKGVPIYIRQFSSFANIPKDSQPVISKEEKKLNDQLLKKYIEMEGQGYRLRLNRTPVHV